MDSTNANIQLESSRLDSAFIKKFKINPVIKIENNLNRKERSNTSILRKHLDNQMALYDEGLKLVIQIHEICKSNHQETKQGFSLLILSAKMVTLLIGIRKMLFSGLVDCVKTLKRPFIETIDIFYACLNNQKLSGSFAVKNEMYDNDQFYWKNFSKGKLKPDISALFRKISPNEEYITYFFERREGLKKFLSNSIHSSFNSSFSNYMMCTLEGEISDDYWGKVTTAYPSQLFSLLEEINLLSQIFNETLSLKISEELKNIDIKEVNPIYTHYYNKFGLLYSLNAEEFKKEAEAFPAFFKEMEDYFKARENTINENDRETPKD